MAAAASRAQTAPPLAPRRRVSPAPRPRRVSGPSRAPSRTAQPRRAGEAGLVTGLIGVFGRLDALASHRLLDRLIRSRLWIGIVAFALIGIVTLQLGLLKLNSSIGRALEREGALQRENAALSVENSELATGSRVESQAGQLGMRLTSVGALQFLHSHARADVAKAAAALRAAPAQEAQHHEAAASAGETATSEEASGASEGSSEPQAAGESSASGTSETASTETRTSESSSAGTGETATSQGASEAESGSLPAGEGGGAAAPGG